MKSQVKVSIYWKLLNNANESQNIKNTATGQVCACKWLCCVSSSFFIFRMSYSPFWNKMKNRKANARHLFDTNCLDPHFNDLSHLTHSFFRQTWQDTCFFDVVSTASGVKTLQLMRSNNNNTQSNVYWLIDFLLLPWHLIAGMTAGAGRSASGAVENTCAHLLISDTDSFHISSHRERRCNFLSPLFFHGSLHKEEQMIRKRAYPNTTCMRMSAWERAHSAI